MVRTVKKVAHDLLPLSDVVTELSTIVSQLLHAVKPHAQFDNVKAGRYFDECAEASDKLAISANLIKKYVHEINEEVDNNNSLKD